MALWRFTLKQQAGQGVLEKSVAEAIFAAECIHGPAQVRLGTRYYIAKKRILLEASTHTGEQVARLLIGYLGREIGEGRFHIECLDYRGTA